MSSSGIRIVNGSEDDGRHLYDGMSRTGPGGYYYSNDLVDLHDGTFMVIWRGRPGAGTTGGGGDIVEGDHAGWRRVGSPKVASSAALSAGWSGSYPKTRFEHLPGTTILVGANGDTIFTVDFSGSEITLVDSVSRSPDYSATYATPLVVAHRDGGGADMLILRDQGTVAAIPFRVSRKGILDVDAAYIQLGDPPFTSYDFFPTQGGLVVNGSLVISAPLAEDAGMGPYRVHQFIRFRTYDPYTLDFRKETKVEVGDDQKIGFVRSDSRTAKSCLMPDGNRAFLMWDTGYPDHYTSIIAARSDEDATTGLSMVISVLLDGSVDASLNSADFWISNQEYIGMFEDSGSNFPDDAHIQKDSPLLDDLNMIQFPREYLKVTDAYTARVIAVNEDTVACMYHRAYDYWDDNEYVVVFWSVGTSQILAVTRVRGKYRYTDGVNRPTPGHTAPAGDLFADLGGHERLVGLNPDGSLLTVMPEYFDFYTGVTDMDGNHFETHEAIWISCVTAHGVEGQLEETRSRIYRRRNANVR